MISISKETTPLDCLLPRSSSFVRMPAPYRAAVIHPRLFVFSIFGRQKEKSRDTNVYQALVGVELFKNDLEIRKLFESYTGIDESYLKEIKVLSNGCFLYDSDDPFLKLLISKAQTIVSTESLRRMTERYFKFLALYSTYYGGYYLEYPLAVLEKSLHEALFPEEEYVPYLKRIGKLAELYRLSSELEENC